MLAVQLTAVHQLAVATVPDPRPAAGEAVVAIRAAALNHRDVWIKAGEYAGLKWPCIPGSDCAGVVVDVGEGVDAEVWREREVIINPSFNWGSNEAAQTAQFSILGLPREGTLAEKVCVPIDQLTAKPSHLTWEEAAALPLAGLTAYRAVFTRAKLHGAERILISGVGGGVALFALQFAVAAGAQVWVTSRSPEKISRAVELGAKGGFNYTDPDWTKAALVAPGSFDVIVDSAGGPGFAKLLDVAAPGGRIVFYGATRGDPPTLPMRKVFWRQLSLLGTTMGSPADWSAMVSFVGRHKLRPIVTEVFPLERAGDAFALMERSEQFGKIVVRVAG
jgi:zinc-binding alcohol dehydrogenase/oxidoreductase